MNSKKFHSILIVFILISISFVYATISSGSIEIEKNNAAYNTYYLSSATRQAGQSFQIRTGNISLGGFSVDARRSSFPDMINVTLYESNGTGPIGPALSTNLTVNASLYGTSFAWQNISMPSYDMVNGSIYTLIIGNTTMNQVHFGVSTGNAYIVNGSNGHCLDNQNDAGWITCGGGSDYDLRFIVWSHVGALDLSVLQISPEDGLGIGTANVTLISNFSGAGLVNSTYFMWDSSGTLTNTSTVTIPAEVNQTNYTINNLEELQKYTWNVRGCQGNGASTNCSWGNNRSIYTYLDINFLDSSGNTIGDNINITCPSRNLYTSSLSPYQAGFSTFIDNGDTQNNVNCTFSGLNEYYQSNTTQMNFSVLTTQYNVSLVGNNLVFNFKNSTGNDVNVTGVWSTTNHAQNFTNSSLIQIQRNLAQGIVWIYWGYDEYTGNYSQFYEYNNDWTTNDEVNLTTIDDGDITSYFEVVDISGKPIEDALIRVSVVDPTIGGNSSLIGQRFTGANGQTFFYFDDNTVIYFIVSKDGYTAKSITPMNSQDFGADTSSTAYKVSLEISGITTKDNVHFLTQTWFNNRSKDIGMSIYAPDRANVTYSTSYRNLLGYSNKSFTLDTYDTDYKELISGTDFSNSGTDDITLYIWIDGTLWDTLTIDYRTIESNIIEEITGIDSTTKNRMLWIGLIVLSAISGLVIATGKGGIGKNIFMSGGILLGFLSIGTFGWLMFSCGLYYSMTIMRRFFSE